MEAHSGVLFVIRAMSMEVVSPRVLVMFRISCLASLNAVCSVFVSSFILDLKPCRGVWGGILVCWEGWGVLFYHGQLVRFMSGVFFFAVFYLQEVGYVFVWWRVTPSPGSHSPELGQILMVFEASAMNWSEMPTIPVILTLR